MKIFNVKALKKRDDRNFLKKKNTLNLLGEYISGKNSGISRPYVQNKLRCIYNVRG